MRPVAGRNAFYQVGRSGLGFKTLNRSAVGGWQGSQGAQEGRAGEGGMWRGRAASLAAINPLPYCYADTP